jgi:hypothetical protein
VDTEQKVCLIETALERKIYTEGFKTLCFKLMRRTDNLDKIIEDINNYQSSITGINQVHIEYAKKTVSQYINPVMITLTARYEESCDELHKWYIKLVNAISESSLKSAYRRYHKTIPNIGHFDEHEMNGNKDPVLHMHAVFDRPNHVSERNFNRELRAVWYATSGFIDIQAVSASDDDIETVCDYITKSKTKGSFPTLHDSYITH